MYLKSAGLPGFPIGTVGIVTAFETAHPQSATATALPIRNVVMSPFRELAKSVLVRRDLARFRRLAMMKPVPINMTENGSGTAALATRKPLGSSYSFEAQSMYQCEAFNVSAYVSQDPPRTPRDQAGNSVSFHSQTLPP